jgi:hypothetical protein
MAKKKTKGDRQDSERDDPSRMTRAFRSREHMAYVDQGKRGFDEREELTRSLRGPFRDIVMSKDA